MPETDTVVCEPRQCGRCRQSFAGDPTLPVIALQDWWVCPRCHDALFGRKGGSA